MKIGKSRRERMIYIVVFLWIIFGGASILLNVNLTELAAYFASLTGFVGMYVWSETKRPHNEND